MAFSDDQLTALITTAAGVETAEQALERFPCQNCSRSLGRKFAVLSPGYVQIGQSASGPMYAICATCQPDASSGPGGLRRYSRADVASVIQCRYPVRFTSRTTLPGRGRYSQERCAVIDSATGQPIAALSDRLHDGQAAALAARMNRLWLVRLREPAAVRVMLDDLPGAIVEVDSSLAVRALIEVFGGDGYQGVWQVQSQDHDGVWHATRMPAVRARRT